MKKSLLMCTIIITILLTSQCSKPCKPLDMGEIDASIKDTSDSVDMFCQINPATELCLDMRVNDM